jgi:hypothetical protein
MIFSAAVLICFGAAALAAPGAQLAPVQENEIRISKWDGSNNILSSESYFFGTYRPTDRCRDLNGRGGGRGGRGGKGGPGGDATADGAAPAKAGRPRGGNGGSRVTKVEKGADLDCGFWEAAGCQGPASKSLPVGKAEAFSVDRPAADPVTAPGAKGRARMAFICTHKSAKA